MSKCPACGGTDLAVRQNGLRCRRCNKVFGDSNLARRIHEENLEKERWLEDV